MPLLALTALAFVPAALGQACARINRHGGFGPNNNAANNHFFVSDGDEVPRIQPWDSWNDEASSAVVEPGCILRLYEHVNYGGDKFVFPAGNNNFVSTWNDELSSYKCNCGGLDSSSPPTLTGYQYEKVVANTNIELWGDRTYTIEYLPPYMSGALLLKGPHRLSAGADISITTSGNSHIYIAIRHDEDGGWLASLPSSGWTMIEEPEANAMWIWRSDPYLYQIASKEVTGASVITSLPVTTSTLVHAIFVTAGGVDCGNHVAATCAACGDAAGVCSGDCQWSAYYQCIGPDVVSCGGHNSNTCAECPHIHGRNWCNGQCTWDDGQCNLG